MRQDLHRTGCSAEPSSPLRAGEPVFIVGCPRSGTTLLAALIDRHSRIAVPPETHFFTYFLAHLPTRRREFSSAHLAKLLLETQYTCDLQLDEEQLVQGLDTDQVSLDEFFRFAMGQFAAERGKQRWAEKTPEHLFFVPTILRCFPGARIICIARDGRDVALSMQAMPWTVSPLRGFAAMWREAAVVAQKYLRQYPSEFHLLRFEDLLASPQDVLTGVMRFVGLEFEPQQLDASRATSVVADWDRNVKRNVFADLDPARAYAWKKAASPAQLRVMNSMMRGGLKGLGYADFDSSTAWPLRLYDALINLAVIPLYHHRMLPARRFARKLLGRLIPQSPHTSFRKPPAGKSASAN